MILIFFSLPSLLYCSLFWQITCISFTTHVFFKKIMSIDTWYFLLRYEKKELSSGHLLHQKYQKSTNIIPLCPPIFSVLNFCSEFLLWSIARPLDQRCEDFWEGSKSLSNVTKFYSHKSLASYSRLGRLRWMSTHI